MMDIDMLLAGVDGDKTSVSNPPADASACPYPLPLTAECAAFEKDQTPTAAAAGQDDDDDNNNKNNNNNNNNEDDENRLSSSNDRMISAYLAAIDRSQLLAFEQYHLVSNKCHIVLHSALAHVSITMSIDCGAPYPFEHVRDGERFQLAWQANTLFVATLERVFELRSVMRSRNAIARALVAASPSNAIAMMQLLDSVATAVDDIERDFATAARVSVHRQHERGQPADPRLAYPPCCHEAHGRASVAMRSFVTSVCKLMKTLTATGGASGERASVVAYATHSSADQNSSDCAASG